MIAYGQIKSKAVDMKVVKLHPRHGGDEKAIYLNADHISEMVPEDTREERFTVIYLDNRNTYEVQQSVDEIMTMIND